jgi:DNA-binding protein H-NS
VKRSDFEQMPIDDLWALRLEVSEMLGARIVAKKSVLEKRLTLLSAESQRPNLKRRHRPYPAVRPRFRNPDDPAVTWTGRGTQPRWVVQQLKSGKRLEELIIQSAPE